jgi:hypothetical protein
MTPNEGLCIQEARNLIQASYEQGNEVLDSSVGSVSLQEPPKRAPPRC